jgi:hypothetical protein
MLFRFPCGLLIPVTRRYSAFLACAHVLAVTIGMAAMVSAHAYFAGFSSADEPSRFLKRYFISS